MDAVVEDLAAQHAQLRGVLEGLQDGEWRSHTRCEGWDVADVVVHLAQSDEMAIGSTQGRYAEVMAELTQGLEPTGSIDEGVAAMVARQRDFPPRELFGRWSASGARG